MHSVFVAKFAVHFMSIVKASITRTDQLVYLFTSWNVDAAPFPDAYIVRRGLQVVYQLANEINSEGDLQKNKWDVPVCWKHMEFNDRGNFPVIHQ